MTIVLGENNMPNSFDLIGETRHQYSSYARTTYTYPISRQKFSTNRHVGTCTHGMSSGYPGPEIYLSPGSLLSLPEGDEPGGEMGKRASVFRKSSLREAAGVCDC